MSKARELSELPNGVDVDANGNVGIGTNTPSGYNSKLAVLGNIAMANTQSRFYPYYISSTNHAYVSSTAGGDLTFGTGLSGVSERMRVDTSGRVTTPNQPMAAVRRVSQDPGTTGNVVIFATTDVNVGSIYNTSNGRFTAPVAGKYFFGAFIIAKNNNSFASFEFYKNGSLQSPVPYSGGNSVPFWGVAGYYIFDLAANDYMEIRTTSSYAYSNANDTNNGAIFYLIG